MELIFLSFLAGIMTVLAPCALPLLPVIIGGSVEENKQRRAFVIVISLALSVTLFTILLKATTFLINVNPQVWNWISGTVLVALGLINLFPHIWEVISIKLKLNQSSGQLLLNSSRKEGVGGEIMTGMALGPVFTSCSPTYGLIIATILPQSFAEGVLYVIIYSLGLAFIMLLIALMGQELIKKLRWSVDPKGWFKKSIGVVLIIVGLLVLTGVQKKIETYLVQNSNFTNNLIMFEFGLLEKMNLE